MEGAYLFGFSFEFSFSSVFSILRNSLFEMKYDFAGLVMLAIIFLNIKFYCSMVTISNQLHIFLYQVFEHLIEDFTSLSWFVQTFTQSMCG